MSGRNKLELRVTSAAAEIGVVAIAVSVASATTAVDSPPVHQRLSKSRMVAMTV